MEYDVELMRDMMLLLETRQLSPRSTVVISLGEVADELGTITAAVAASLDLLLRLDYIDGAGQDEYGYWLFRKLTRKGVEFVRQARRPKDWERLKRHYGQAAVPEG